MDIRKFFCIFAAEMRKITLIIAFFCYLTAFGLDTDWRVSTRAGWIMNDGKVEKVAPDRLPAMGGEVAVAFHPEWSALRQWNNSSAGVALSYWYMGDRMLGHAIAPYAFLDIPLVRCPHFVLGLRPGIGCAFMTKTYRNTAPEGHLWKDVVGANQCIGSVFNFYFPEAFYMDFPIRNGWAITIGGGWYHISNGSIRQPNSGYNTFAAEVGVRYTPQDASPALSEQSERLGEGVPEGRGRGFELELVATGGGRQVYYKDRKTFGCATIEASAYWRAHNIFRLGGGIDVFYDGAYCGYETNYQKTAQHLARPSDCWRVGVSIQPEFVIGHFVAGFHVGAYLYDEVKNLEAEAGTEEHSTLWDKKERLHRPLFYKYDILNAGSAGYPDGWLYTAIVLKYHLPYHLMLQAEMKAHLTKVEFVSVGLGAWL